MYRFSRSPSASRINITEPSSPVDLSLPDRKLQNSGVRAPARRRTQLITHVHVYRLPPPPPPPQPAYVAVCVKRQSTVRFNAPHLYTPCARAGALQARTRLVQNL
uniref:Uncharacterized protein n=1 Tax=Trichogramma kaykai TaxID=54128 RepID=A0ABD2XAE2_9HYME